MFSFPSPISPADMGNSMENESQWNLCSFKNSMQGSITLKTEAGAIYLDPLITDSLHFVSPPTIYS